jgi:RimJ/RimL family protein N-acetyltransferase
MTVFDPLPIETSRIRLRRLSTDDVRDFQAYRTDPEVGLYQGWTPMSGAQALAFLAQMRRARLFVPGEWAQIGIELRGRDGGAGPLIGDIGIGVDGEDSSHARIGFSMNLYWQGRGLASEAVAAARTLLFEHAGVRRLEGITDTRNKASIRLLERLGFRLDRTEDALFRGLPCREHHYLYENGGR